ncbi:MAG: YSC84-related protein [Pseudomonadota bacterium]|nr:YSC84-related protein [Pseudomonadota bacterium]
MHKRKFLAALGVAALLAACSTTSPNAPSDPAGKRASIDANVSGALTKLYTQDPGARELVAKARGVLVFPSVVSAGFVVGGSYGTGALMIHGDTVGYYSTTAASVGLLAGAESKAVYLLFMNDEALNKFRASNGWTAGADASVSVIKAGANAGLDTQTMRAPVIGFVLTNGGLMANLSIDGTKVNRLAI